MTVQIPRKIVGPSSLNLLAKDPPSLCDTINELQECFYLVCWHMITLSDAAKVHIYSPDQEDCLLFHYEFTGRIKVNQVICQLTAEGGAISYVEDDFYLKIRPRKKILGKQITPNFFCGRQVYFTNYCQQIWGCLNQPFIIFIHHI